MSGSFWIYENIKDKSIERVVLKSCELDTLGPSSIGKGYSLTNEAYVLDYHSSVYGNYTDTYYGYVIARGPYQLDYIYLSNFDIGNEVRNARIADIHDTLIIKGTSYNRVVEMTISKDDFIDTDMRLFYVDSIGIVQKILIENPNDSITWQLNEYEVELKSN